MKFLLQKSLFKAYFLLAALMVLAPLAFATKAHAVDLSVGLNYGYASSHFSCDRCPSLEEATSNPYNLELRGFVTTPYNGLQIGLELAAENSPSTPLRYGGRDIATTSGYKFSAMPMLRMPVTDRIKIFGGFGIASDQMEINAGGQTWRDTNNSAPTAKAGAEYLFPNGISVHAQWVWDDERHAGIGGTDAQQTKNQGQLGVAYNF